MKSLFKNFNQEFDTTLICMTVICYCCLGISIMDNILLCFELGKDDTEGFMWQVLPRVITMVVMAVCSILILVLLRNVKRRNVFIIQNSSLVLSIGFVVECNGIFQWFLSKFDLGIDLSQTYMIFLLLGVFIIMIGYVLKIGVRLKEEQELTI